VRIWIAIVVVVGCKKVDNQHARELPLPTNFAAMSPEAQCTATAPRARPCHNELLRAEMRSLGLLDTSAINDKPVDDKEADVLHLADCDGSPGYARAIVECWAQPSCDELAKCTFEYAAKLEGSAAPRVDSGSDLDLGSDVPNHKVVP